MTNENPITSEKETTMRLPVMTHICNKAVEKYNNSKDSADGSICYMESRINKLANDPSNRKITETLIANHRLTKSTTGHLYIRLDQ